MTCIRLLSVAILFLSAAAGAQVKPGDGPQGGDQPTNRAADKGAVLDKRSRLGIEDEASMKERLANQKEGGGVGADHEDADAKAKGGEASVIVNHSSRGFCRLDASIRPKRLLPGQTGTLTVLMVLEGDSVLTAPANVQVAYQGGTMTVGAAVVHPASRGTVAKAYVGQLVYDNYAIVEMPVTMPSTAVLGTKQSASLDFDFELFQGATGKHLGQFKERVNAACEVGSVLDPSVQQRVSTPTAVPEVASRPGDAATPAAVPPASALQAGEGDVVPQATPADAPAFAVAPTGASDSPSRDALPIDESTSSTALWLGGVGAALAAILLLLFRRR